MDDPSPDGRLNITIWSVHHIHTSSNSPAHSLIVYILAKVDSSICISSFIGSPLQSSGCKRLYLGECMCTDKEINLSPFLILQM